MKRILLTAAVIAAGLTTTACVTIIDAGHDHGWRAKAATPFNTARDLCRDRTGNVDSRAFEACMSEQGWTRD